MGLEHEGTTMTKTATIKKLRCPAYVNQICRNLGRYDIEEQAARVYDIAAKAAWGEFASINFPESEKVPA